MARILFIVALLLVSTFSITDKEILQQALNGIFEENKLADPTTIVECIDDDTAHKIVVFAGELLAKAAKGSVSDLLSLVQLIKDFGDQIPKSVKDCLDGNAQFKALGLKYGIDDSTDTSALEKKVITYITLHYLSVHKWLGSLNDNWKAGKYYQVGFDAGGYGHQILGHESGQLPNKSDSQILQQYANGIYEYNGLPDTTMVSECVDDDLAQKTVAFWGQVLERAARGSVTDILRLPQFIQKFVQQNVPQSVGDCINSNQSLYDLAQKYGITDETDPEDLANKIIAYVTVHYLSVHRQLGQINDSWAAGNFYQSGQKSATLGHSILDISPEQIIAIAFK